MNVWNRVRLLVIGWLLLTLVSIMQGCVRVLEPRDMVPNAIPVISAPINKTVRIMDVTGAPPVSGLAVTSYPVENEVFKETLQLALSQAKYFRTVQMVGNTDIELIVEILTNMSVGLSQYKIIVDYTFVESQSGKVLWQHTAYSDCEGKLSEANHDAKKCSVRENISSLLTTISTEWPLDAR